MECDPGYDVFIGALTWPLLASPRSVTHYAPSFTRMRPYPSLLSIILFLQLFIQHFDQFIDLLYNQMCTIIGKSTDY